MAGGQRSNGQAAVELVALLPVIVALVLAGWIAVRSAAEMERAAGAARSAARAKVVGAPPRRAASVLLPGGSITSAPDGRTTVRAKIPSALPGLAGGIEVLGVAAP